MTKTYHFMAGLPRSGSTVLSAILNQNPQIYSSPPTQLVEMLFTLQTKIPNYESYKANLLREGYHRTLQSVTDNFYSIIDKPVVIDMGRTWGTPYNWNYLSPYVNPTGKVILTLRPILEVLASFVRVIKDNESKGVRTPYFDENLFVSHYRPATDAIVDSLMLPNSSIDQAIFSIANLLRNHKDRVLIVWYDDLVETPEETLNSIYEFLELDRFKHDFSNIVSVERYDDLAGYQLKGLHDVKSKLTKSATKPEDYLSDYVIKKYGGVLDFLNT
jgi:sulfotransferase